MADKTLYYDFEKDYEITSTGSKAANFPKLGYQENPEWELNVKTVTGTTVTAKDLSAATSWAAAVDNDYIHTLVAGELFAAYSGAQTAIRIDGLGSTYTPPDYGVIHLDNGTNQESVAYSAVVENATGDYTFTVDVTLTYSYLENDTATFEVSPPMCRTLDADIDDTDSATGKIIVSLDADTGVFMNKIGSTQTLLAYFELYGFAAGKRIFKFRMPISAVNTVDPNEGVQTASGAPPSSIYNKGEVDSLVNAKVDEDLSGYSDATPLDGSEVVYLSGSEKATTQDIADLGGGGGLPVADTTAIVKGSADATKLLRFEVDGLTTATTRVATPPDADFTMVGVDTSQALTNKSVNGVTLTTGGASTNFLNETGAYSAPAGGGSGDVVGPASAVDENICVFDSTTGKLIKDFGTNISAVTANTAKVTNATHTGDVTGSGALSVQPVMITGQSSKATPIAADSILIIDSADSDTLKKTTLTSLIGGGGGGITGISEKTADYTVLDGDNDTLLVLGRAATANKTFTLATLSDNLGNTYPIKNANATYDLVIESESRGTDAAQAGTTATVINATSHGFVAGQVLEMTSGDESGEIRRIDSVTTNAITLENALSGAPSATETFEVFDGLEGKKSITLGYMEIKQIYGADLTADEWLIVN